jgi:hypothetical protein
MAFTSAAQSVWWLVAGLGAGILALGLLSTGRWARATASRAAALFEVVDQPATPPGRPSPPQQWAARPSTGKRASKYD